MTSSLTTDLEEMTISNEQLRREVDVIKTEATQLRTDNDKQKDETGRLTTLLDKMAVNNENQLQQINSQSSEIVQLRTEVDIVKAENVQLKSENDDLRRQNDTPTLTGRTHEVKVSYCFRNQG